MGFLNAVYELGKQNEEDELNSFLKLPLPFQKTGKNGEPKKSGNEIRIYLSVENVNEKPLNVLGVAKVDLVDFMGGEPEIVKWKEKYLYREPAGPGASWKFTPILKIGKPPRGEDERRSAFIGDDNGWQNSNKTHFFKIKNRMLMDYENSGYFSSGSVDKIMKELESKIDKITDLFSEKESHLLVFGVEKNGDFLYPGDVPAFVEYFKEKMNSQIANQKDEKKPVSTKSIRCSMCGKETNTFVNLSKVFKFATFDKESFLPALDENVSSKVFPICSDCFASFSNGRERLDREFTDGRTIPGIKIWCIPEVIGPGSSNSVEDVASQLKKYVSKENTEIEDMFDILAKFENENLLFHFIFWEQKNAQELVHMMVEDVPPTQLKMIEKCWVESLKAIETKEEMIQKKKKLSTALKFVYGTIMSIERKDDVKTASTEKKNEAETKFLRDFAIKVIGNMLNKEKINVDSVKSMFVERIPKILHEKSKIKPFFEIKNMFLMIDFISRFNSEVGK